VTPVQVTIDVHDLAARLGTGEAVTLLDVRWVLGDPHGYRHYTDAHLPGAVYVDLDTELAAPPSTEDGRHPLPALADLQAAARRWGVSRDRLVVAYDGNGNTASARAWWLLRWGGHEQVLLLDGGLAAWRSAGLGLQSGDAEPVAPGDFTLTGGGLPLVDADEVAVFARTGVVLDARAAERYRGETEPVDPRAGHIPGARSAPTAGNLLSDGRFRPTEELRARFAALGADGSVPVAAYCGSGVTAAHDIAALALVGIDAALYPGSWSQWSANPSLPAVTGPDPG
jgi:thiosulfate/3-mercaptopyruvate sulfurtransferase